MAKGMILRRGGGGGGGGGLNYSVRACASVSALPAAGNVNEIAVITSTAIDAHTFAATQPTARADGTALQAGDVWLATGSQSNFPFNALANLDGLYVYGQFASQYDGSTWQAVAAKIWYGGAWVDWGLRLYWDGNEQTSATGGWTDASGDSHGTVTKNADNIVVAVDATKNKYGQAATALPIDITGVNTIKCKVRYAAFATGERKMYLSTTLGGTAVASAAITYNIDNATYSIDTSALTGEHYVQIYIGTGNSSSPSGGSITVYRVWAE